ncbi:Uncharacterised protein [Raoultella planticola]|uniref:Phosphonate C-P lyase system protein PhnG n=1 Tax=Raoultella planticola TaxID=575 RepID=A0A485AMS1_RAOPL|nr:Uncharacterised protein [Raoultella planticola]
MHFDTATRQRWMSVLAHSEPEELLARDADPAAGAGL